MVPAFDKVVFSRSGTGANRPLHTQFGYYIIKVLHVSSRVAATPYPAYTSA